MSLTSSPTPSLSTTLTVPDHATAAAFSDDCQVLAVGSDDGSVRFYAPPLPRVTKALRALGAPVSAIVFRASLRNADAGAGASECWVAAGKRLFLFDLRQPVLILAPADAVHVADVGQDDEDAVNHLALSANRAHLACTTDTGGVYVIDAASPGRVLTRMKVSHTSIAWTASFIPDRPSELISGGYDCALLLFDFKLGTLLARLVLEPAPAPAPGLASLPPFVTALAVSPHGALAAGTADGRVWLGLAGEKRPTTTKKDGNKRTRSRKWAALSPGAGAFTKVGESMVTSLHFLSPDELISCTLHGALAVHRLVRPDNSNSSSGSNPDSGSGAGAGSLRTTWSARSAACAKVDVLAMSPSVPAISSGVGGSTGPTGARWLALAGLHTDLRRGAVEVWAVGGGGTDGISAGTGTGTDRTTETGIETETKESSE
ncbi:hypothetical protein M0805_002763 [Coniferiporia weirii]|nr:hypothetical protein M0805_002763 [Coniferiporia weirii]